MTGRFDPNEGEPYGKCLVCETDFLTQDEANSHMRDTMPGTGGVAGHRVRITNPTRQERISREVSWFVTVAVEDLHRELFDLIDRGEVTKSEIKAALSSYPDFSDGWDEYATDGAA